MGMMKTAVPYDLTGKFGELVAAWKTGSMHMSNSAQMALLRPYQQIIGLGWPAIPLILGELQREPDHWFWALEMITQQNPVDPSSLGNIREMTESWIQWGIENGFIEP